MMDWSFNEHYRDRYETAMEFAKLLNEDMRALKREWDRKYPGKKLEIQILKEHDFNIPLQFNNFRD